ncbi:Alpha/Beta hydrolase protein [Amylocarpus encephaloides]|uniref:Alpha/Beta hydrolase protein n=1 Tax=Amylocarpus encephaloides TaxID=45428 RepID=A0A9P7YP24_9HELO|nr:Alpha/Beta hydrolase protein [Amylocarpus encephaloides]
MRGDTHEHHIPIELNGSNFTYLFPVKLFEFQTQHGQTLEMAFMDVPPTGPSNNQTAILLHGKNFCGATWNATVIVLASAGYRVILPDQIVYQLAPNTLALLDILQIDEVTVIGHSMGGMLAARFSLLYPNRVYKLVLTNPIGLENWIALGVPYPTTDSLWTSEKATTYASIRGYQQATYYVGTWDPSYDVWVYMLLSIYTGSRSGQFTWNSELVTDMVLTQPVVYEFVDLKVKTSMMIREKNNTAIGKASAPPEVQKTLGRYYILGPKVAAMIPGAMYVGFKDLGHSPQIQAPDRYHDALLGWLKT